MTSSHDYKKDKRNNKIKIFINGKFFNRNNAKISVFESSNLLGDGIWTGIRLHNGKLLFLKDHLQRLYDDAKAISLKIHVNKKELTWELVSQKEYNILTAQTGADVNVFYGSSTTEGQYILSNNFVAPNYWSSTLNASLFSYIVKIKVTDGGGLSDETEFIVRTPA